MKAIYLGTSQCTFCRYVRQVAQRVSEQFGLGAMAVQTLSSEHCLTKATLYVSEEECVHTLLPSIKRCWRRWT